MTDILSRAARTWAVFVPIFVLGMALLAGMPAIVHDLHQWETQNRPVVTGATIVDMQPIDSGRHTKIVVALKKTRDCEYVRAQWQWLHTGTFWVDAVARAPEDVDAAGHDLPPDSRPVGAHVTRWLTDIPWEQRQSPIRGLFRHRCYEPFGWVTTTVLVAARSGQPMAGM